jgi:mannose-6-phosphate isomerase-like protein (cupin superfamily)
MTRVGITGHQRLPAAGVEFIRQRLREHLEVVRPLMGVTSLAAGADQMFAQMVLELGGTLHVVVPAREYPRSFESEAERAEYFRLLESAGAVEIMDFEQPGEPAYLAAGHRMVDLSDWVIAVWDGLPARGLGGTGDIVKYARATAKKVEIVWPTGMTRD